MSKMPAKKKSCFQITSVTQAQVAANNATDDTESLDDPDESRTEDVSSEIFDVSRTDCEPEVCDRSSSEETLNNACEPEGALAPVNGGGLRNPPASGGQQSGAVTNSSSVTSIASCSSRFRVIKLDHGTGEPFRRGRWTCTEYYEKDPEGSVVASRTVDSIRHANVSEPVADRDSGLGATVVSGMGQTPETSYNGSFSSQAPLEPHTFSVAPPQAVSSSPESFSNKPVPPSIPQQPAPGSSHVAVVHSLLPDGAHQGAHLQKSPSMPAPQVQPPLYQTQPTTHHMQTPSALISASQPDFTQHQMPISITQAGSSLSVGPAVMPTSSPLATPSTGGIQIVSTDVQPVSYPVPSLPSLAQHTGLEVLSGLATSVPQYQASGAMHSLPTAPQSVQNVPTAPATIAISSMPASSAPTAVPGSAAGAALNPSALNPNGAAVANHADEGRRISDAFAQVPDLPSKDTVKPSITEGLQLSNPTASFFGISIPIDGEEDRNPSTVFFQAFQSGSRLKESKMTSDSASGASVVAIDNKIEQAMDLVKSHLMYAVREEVEVLKEQIKELYERNSMLERENAVLKSLANSEQLSQVSVKTNSNVTPPSQGGPGPTTAQPQAPPYLQLDANKTPDSLPRQPQPNVTSA